jgi:SAM-dependent methyltransferase
MPMFGGERWEMAPAEVDAMVALLGIKPGAAVLDLCCGVGRYALELARKGFYVTGVDRTAAYLQIAREKATVEHLGLDLVQDDMRHFVRPSAFDAAINLYTSFVFFEDPADDRKVVENVLHSLRPGGC